MHCFNLLWHRSYLSVMHLPGIPLANMMLVTFDFVYVSKRRLLVVLIPSFIYVPCLFIPWAILFLKAFP